MNRIYVVTRKIRFPDVFVAENDTAAIAEAAVCGPNDLYCIGETTLPIGPLFSAEDFRPMGRLVQSWGRHVLKIATGFTTAPGPRYAIEGKHSGEEFRRVVLVPKMKESRNWPPLVVDLDGTSGYGCAFLEEAFGGLIRAEGFQLGPLKKALAFVSNEEPDLLVEINHYMEAAERVRVGTV